MMVKRMAAALVLAAVLLFSGHAGAADSAAKDSAKGTPQTQCPILSGKIDKGVYTDYQGKRIYFCCAGCIDEFKKDPDKYINKMEEQGVQIEKAPQGNKQAPPSR